MKKGRDMVHVGWRLIASPLYGNLKPNQQPYRTLVLTKGESSAVDFESLQFIENAIRYYESSHVLRLPGSLPEETDKDFRYIDYMLMEETFRAGGMLIRPLTRCARKGGIEKKLCCV